MGSFAKAGDLFATDAKVLDVNTKKLLKSVSAKGKGEESILTNQINELSKEILSGIGISESQIETTEIEIADVTTTSLEAYSLFVKGKENLEKLYYDEARQFFEKAIVLDPTFATAYSHLSRVYFFLGNLNASTTALAKAKTFSTHAPEKEKLYLDAEYALAM